MNEYYLQKAVAELPRLIETTVTPAVESKTLFRGDRIIIDLGDHYVGYFSFRMNWVDLYVDAPVRLYVKFCETKRELEDDFAAYQGRLCASWLQEEVINVDFPGEYRMPRRYAARYIEITVKSTPKRFVLSDFAFRAVTSGDVSAVASPVIANDRLREIDRVAVNTLKNCMQRVFEDGPKRDRRLWTGDLRLEALANYYTFRNDGLVRRCLYLFAATEPNDKGFFPGFLYEDPVFVSGSWYLMDYALLLVVSLCDYYRHTGDRETFLDLYPAAKSQMEAAARAVDGEGILSIPNGCDAFIDWCPDLRKGIALHGVYLYTLDLLAGVLQELSHADAEMCFTRLESAKTAAFEHLHNKEENRFVSPRDGDQYSVHSAVWMILGGVVDGKEGVRILHDALKSADSLKPVTPYMHHYVIEAMFKLGLAEEAMDYLRDYWGAMVDLSADTFFEAFIPGQPDFSPYGDRMINSMCHAWSCTPSYFIRRYACR
ncbi:MAG: hypothetical protein IJW98_03320 [Clostridia bacterium]|nr:hypothetical protein [Clostridia bacterium]